MILPLQYLYDSVRTRLTIYTFKCFLLSIIFLYKKVLKNNIYENEKMYLVISSLKKMFKRVLNAHPIYENEKMYLVDSFIVI